MTLREFFERTYKLLSLADASPATVADYSLQVTWLERQFARELVARGEPSRPLALGDLSDELLAAAMLWRREAGCSAATCNKLFRVVKAVWHLAVKRGHVARSPQAERFREPQREPVAWLPEEWAAILQAAAAEPGRVGDVSAGAWYLALLWFLYSTGVRISAAMATPTANFDARRAEVLVPAASQKQRADQRLQLVPPAVEALVAIRPERHVRLFDDWPYDRTVRQWPALCKRLKRILARAGLPASRRDLFHKIRRTTITHVDAGAGLAVAQKLAGHSDPRVTRAYIDRRLGQVVDVSRLLPQPKVELQLRLFAASG